MAQFYSLEEAARVLGMSPDDLKAKAQTREVRAFLDQGSWRFRVADVDELARGKNVPDDDESIDDFDLSGSESIDFSEFALGASAAAGPSPVTADLPNFSAKDDDDARSGLFLGPGGASGSGLVPADLLASGSDIRLAPDFAKGSSDSDVRVAPALGGDKPGEGDLTLFDSSEEDFPLAPSGSTPAAPAKAGDTAVRSSPMLGSSAEIPSLDDDGFDASGIMEAAGRQESGSDFELSAFDASDEFEAAPVLAPHDSDVTAAQASDSGVNLKRPSDSGISLQSDEAFDFSQSLEIELAPIDEEDDEPKKTDTPKPSVSKPAAAAAAGLAAAGAAAIAAGAMAADKGKGKSIHEDTDFELEAVDSGELDDKTAQVEAASDFEIEGDSGQDIYSLDEDDDADSKSGTKLAPRAVAAAEDDSDGFESDSDTPARSDWAADDSDSSQVVPQGGMISGTRGDQVEWGTMVVSLLGVGAFFVFMLAAISIDLMRNLHSFNGDGPASGLIKSLASMFGG